MKFSEDRPSTRAGGNNTGKSVRFDYLSLEEVGDFLTDCLMSVSRVSSLTFRKYEQCEPISFALGKSAVHVLSAHRFRIELNSVQVWTRKLYSLYLIRIF